MTFTNYTTVLVRYLTLLIVILTGWGCNNNRDRIDDTYILAPSQSLHGADPEANWIWDSGEANPRNYFLYARKTFSLPAPAREARAFISAHAFAELYINGEYIDRLPTNPDPEYQTYEEIDLIPFLKEGINSIAVLVYNTGEGLHHRMDARGGFFFQATISDNSGGTTRILSDKTWRVSQAKAWDSTTKHRQGDHTIGMRERYDARLAIEGWQLTSFNDSDWEQAFEIGVPPLSPWNNIVVIRRERLHYEILEPVKSWETQGYMVYDFGKEITAFPRFKLNTPQAGLKVILGTGERLNAEGLPEMRDNVDYTDTYITREGSQSWQPLTWRGFRYMAIQKSPEISIEDVRAEFRSFPVQRTGSFSCSDELLNRIWETGRWTLQICAHDTWMDTPWREQTQYIAGDTRYDMRYAVYAFGSNIKLLNDYNLLSGAFSQRHSRDGAIRSRYPTGYHLGPTTSTYIPDYQLEWILMLREHYMYYHDTELIKQVYPNLKDLLSYFKSYVSDERGLVGKVPGWVVLDHPDTYPMDVDGENTGINCLYYGALNSAAWMARNILGDHAQAEAWELQAQDALFSIQKYLWSEENMAYKDGFESSRITQQTQVYALKYGLVPEDLKPGVVSYVKSQDRSCEQSFSYWLLHTMFSEGEGQWALDYIRTYWGEQMKRADFNGAWHEMWDTWGTTSHSWCSGPTALLPEKVLGVEALQPGWKQFSIKPDLCDLEWAQGVIPSVAGDISVKLKRIESGESDTGMQINLVVPERSTAKVFVPVQLSESYVIRADQKKIWEDGTAVDAHKKISFSSVRDNYVVFEFQPGSFEILSTKKI